MKLKKIIFIIFMFLLIAQIGLAEEPTDREYFMLCVNYGESYLSAPQTRVCDIHTGCKICAYEFIDSGLVYAAHPTYLCANMGLSCGDDGAPVADIEPPVITINFPDEGYVSPDDYVQFSLEFDEFVTLYLIDSQDPGREKRICSECLTYDKGVRLDEGQHVLTFKALDWQDNEATKDLEIFVDSKEPKIRGTLPEEGYVNTVFTIEYDEENLQSVVLHYKQTGDWIDVELQGCQSGIKQTCSSEDIPLDDGEVQYYFTISDSATSVDSNVITLMVDTTDPVVEINEPQSTPYNEKRIIMDIVVSEEVETLEYIDAADPRGRWRRLCRNCDEYDRSKSFGEGFHDLIIKATDYAGNEGEAYISFTIDSKDPRIKRIEPRKGKYGNGNFYIKYQEDNLQKIELYYKEIGEGEYTVVTKTDCPSGKNAECYFYVPELEGIEEADYSYYFVVYDLATDVQSKEYEFVLDSVAPSFIKADKTVDGSKVYFDIELSEDSKLEYMDSYDGDRAKFRRLCSNCDSYDRRKSFRTGHHELTLRVTDRAENINLALMDFDIE